MERPTERYYACRHRAAITATESACILKYYFATEIVFMTTIRTNGYIQSDNSIHRAATEARPNDS